MSTFKIISRVWRETTASYVSFEFEGDLTENISGPEYGWGVYFVNFKGVVLVH